MATTAAAHLSVFTGKLRLRLRTSWPMFLIYTSMFTYITSYKAINTKLIGWVPSPSARYTLHIKIFHLERFHFFLRRQLGKSLQ